MGKIRFGVLCAIVMLIAVISGCSQEGTLVVRNQGKTVFQGTVENTQVMIDPGTSYSASIYIGKTLTFVGPTDLKVTIEGSSETRRLFRDEIDIKDNQTTVYPLIDDVGACNFANVYSLAVNELHFKKCSDTEFGPNVIEKNHSIGPGTMKAYQFDPGCWDILVNYGRQGFLDTVTSVPFEVGKIISISWVPGYVYTPPPPSGR
jgi:hypothetical protein